MPIGVNLHETDAPRFRFKFYGSSSSSRAARATKGKWQACSGAGLRALARASEQARHCGGEAPLRGRYEYTGWYSHWHSLRPSDLRLLYYRFLVG